MPLPPRSFELEARSRTDCRTPVIYLTDGTTRGDYHTSATERRGEPMAEITHKRPRRITRTDYVLVTVAAVTWLLCTFGALLS